MQSRLKFALVLLVGVGLVVLGFTILSIGDQEFVSKGLSNPTGYVAPCNPGNGSGCAVWPYISVALFVVGVILTLAGFIGLVETVFPREAA